MTATNGRIGLAQMAACLLLALPAVVNGQPSIMLKSNQPEVGVNQTFSIQAILTTSANQPFSEVKIPIPATFEKIGRPTSSQRYEFSSAQGRMSARTIITYYYTLRARKQGVFTIGPASFKAGQRRVFSASIRVRVGVSSGVASDPEMFLKAEVDRNEVYLGQQVTVSFILYSRLSVYNLNIRRMPRIEGFWLEDVEVPRRFGQQHRNFMGRRFRIHIIQKKALFPLKAGVAHIGSMQIAAQTSFSWFQTKRLTRHSAPLSIKVKALPLAGQPPGFESTNVGRFRLHGQLDQREVKLGEPLSFTLILSGEGNIKNVRMPMVPKAEWYQRYDPVPSSSIRTVNSRIQGRRSLKYLLQPKRPGIFKTAEIKFIYFDPFSKKYGTLRIPPYSIRVRGKVAKPTRRPSSGTSAPTEFTEVGFMGIHESALLVKPAQRLHRVGFFWFMLMAPPLILLFLIAFEHLRNARRLHRGKMRTRHAAGKSLRQLQKAEKLLNDGQPKELFSELARILISYLEVRLAIPVSGRTLDELRLILSQLSCPAALIEQLVAEMENFDFARFAPASTRSEEMKESFKRVRQLIMELDRWRPAKIKDAKRKRPIQKERA